MILFTIAASLIGLAFTLFFLPLRILSGVLKIVLLPVRIVTHLIFHNIFLLIIVVVIGLIYFSVRDSNVSLPQLTPAAAPSAPPSGMRQQKGVPLVEPVLKKEDGDSNFATDLYALMTEEERARYSQQFYWAMVNLQNGQAQTWESFNIAGSLRPNDTFTNNSGVRCRHFSEVLKVHTIQQTLSGTACEEGTGAWCKLKPNATPSCGLSAPSGNILDGLKGLF